MIIILIALGGLYSIYKVYIAYEWVEKKPESDYPPGVIDQILLPTSICTHSTGIYLVKCTSKKDIIPIEDAYPGDIGYALLGNLITSLKGSILTKADYVKIHIWLNWVGLIILVVSLIGTKLKWTAILTLLIGSYFLEEINWPNYHSSMFGIFCIVIVAIIGFTHFPPNRKSKGFLSRYKLLFLSMVCLTVALLLREPIGYIGVASILFIHITFFVTENKKWNPKILIKYVCIVLLIFSLNFVTETLLFVRSVTWNISVGIGHPKHALSHSLVIGLGIPYVINPWGITRSDATGIYLVKNVKEGVTYASREYYAILWKIYLKMIVSQPLDIVKIYWKTLLKTLIYPTKLISNYLNIIIFLSLMIIFFKYFKSKHYIIIRLISGVGIASILALAQGMFSHPYFASISEFGFIVCNLALVELIAVPNRRKADYN